MKDKQMRYISRSLALISWMMVMVAPTMCAEWQLFDEQVLCDDIVEVALADLVEATSTRKFGDIGHNFTAFDANEILGTPPDMEGSVGPTQYIGIINGWIRSFNKKTGKADNILNIALGQFFAPIAKDSGPFDVRIRFDRFTDRWFMLCENKVSGKEKKLNPMAANKMFITVSDGPIITRYTKWRYFAFTIGSPGVFADYPTLGIDVNALYVGTSLFPDPAQPENQVRLFVLPKLPFVSGGTPIMYTFNAVSDEFGNTTSVAQGVNNVDAAATTGYFIGVNNGAFGLVLYKVANPATVPTLSPPIPISSGIPLFVDPLSDIPSKDGIDIDGGDTRLLCAHIRNNHLWTVHGVGVNNMGQSSNAATVSRNACRWYELDLVSPVPTVVQTGVLYMPSPTNVKGERSYVYPSLMTSGQYNMVLGCSTTASDEYINAAFACRTSSDIPGTLRAPTLYTTSSVPYKSDANRWGDYNFVAIDPCNDMTFWTIQQYCQQVNPFDPAQSLWACQVAQIMAPPPATPIAATAVDVDLIAVDVVVTGSAIDDGAFFDPGPEYPCRIQAQVSGGIIVNSVTYNSPTQVTLNISTTAVPYQPVASYDVTIINPDGQARTGIGILDVFCSFCGG